MNIENLNNRFIYDFDNQDADTIWRFLNNTLYYNYDVYAGFQKGYMPYLPDNKLYIYAHDRDIVVVCLEACGNGEEQAYRESEEMMPMIYLPDGEPRESTLWKFHASLKMMHNRLVGNGMYVTIHGILLTEANILNADELEDMWASDNIKVICGLKNVNKKNVRLSYSNGKHFEPLVNIIFNEFANLRFSEAELERMLQKFAENPHIDTQEPDDDPLLNFTEDQDLDEESDDNTSLDEDTSDEDIDLATDSSDTDKPSDNASESSFRDEYIQQNDYMSVKVTILLPLANPREELDKLIGCTGIKRRMDELVALTRYNKMMRELLPDSKQHEVSLHSLFLGRPGTGKTTVAKIYGSLLHQAGALSKGHVVLCDRSTFIGKYYGDEERVVMQVLDKAKGGVLMIDEAYLFNSFGERDPGQVVIQQLLSILADESQRDIAVLLCGYKEPMQKLIDMNPGLESRFPNKFEFNDFSVSELLEITQHRIREYNYQFTDGAWEKYGQLLEQAYQSRDPQTWGNARFVANQLEQIYMRHATRCVQEHSTDKSQLLTLTPDDIMPFEAPRPPKKIGFC